MFNQERTYGVEVEYFGLPREIVAQELRNIGIKVEVEGYNHSTKDHWKIVTDASVTATGTNESRGSELVSPILKGAQGLLELEKILNKMDEIGCKVDRTCGIHVHHYIGEFKRIQIKNIYAIYMKHEEDIDMMLPKSRRENRFCRSLNSVGTLEEISNANILRDIDNIFRGRYYKLNLTNFSTIGTIEFRQHNGSLNAEKVMAWVVFTQAIVEKAKGRVTYKKSQAKNQLDVMFRTLGMTGHYGGDEMQVAVVNFLKKRHKHFKEAM